MKYRLGQTLTILVLLMLPITIPAQAKPQAGEPMLFPATGHTLAYTFREFFDTHGGLPIFGYPLTEVFNENGRPVQYFERARMEWHVNLGLVQTGHLGRWASEQREGLPAFQPVPAPATSLPESDYFPETGHTLRGELRSFWHNHGGLPIFGLPLSEEFIEQNTEDGQEYTVQYFERARFELHPELPSPYRVSLGHLGRRYLDQHEVPAWALQPVADNDAAWATFRPTRVVVSRIGIDTEVTEAGFSLGAWDVPRYTAGHYWPVSAYPGTQGNIIIAGHVGYKDTIFNHLPQSQVGDEIIVYVGDTPHHYVIHEILTLLPSQSWVMLPMNHEILTLITCVPIGTYTHRLVVRAEPVSAPSVDE